MLTVKFRDQRSVRENRMQCIEVGAPGRRDVAKYHRVRPFLFLSVVLWILYISVDFPFCVDSKKTILFGVSLMLTVKFRDQRSVRENRMQCIEVGAPGRRDVAKYHRVRPFLFLSVVLWILFAIPLETNQVRLHL